MTPLVSIQNPVPEILREGVPRIHETLANKALKLVSPFTSPSRNFSGPGFWILTKGVVSRPVQGLTCPNLLYVFGIKHPNVQSPNTFELDITVRTGYILILAMDIQRFESLI